MKNTTQDAIFWFLEEIPIQEMFNEETIEIVKGYREGFYDVLEASHLLEEECHQDLAEWIHNNRLMNTICSDEDEE